MNVHATALPGVLLVEPAVFRDDRGSFLETYHRGRYLRAGIAVDLAFVQDNFSTSVKGTLRGLHHQLARPQGKLVWVTAGEIFDVAVDVRRGSPTFGQWHGAMLSAENHLQMWIPPGFAHGFLATSPSASVAYKVTEPYSPDDERCIRWDDPALAIAWPLDGATPRLSRRDAEAPGMRDSELPSYAP